MAIDKLLEGPHVSVRALVTSAASSVTDANDSVARRLGAHFADHTGCDRLGAPWVRRPARHVPNLRCAAPGYLQQLVNTIKGDRWRFQEQILDLLRQRGDNDKAEQAKNELARSGRHERDSGILDRLGIDPKDLLGGLGGAAGSRPVKIALATVRRDAAPSRSGTLSGCARRRERLRGDDGASGPLESALSYVPQNTALCRRHRHRSGRATSTSRCKRSSTACRAA